MSDVLSILINASRPFKKFEVTIGEQKFDLYARRPGNAESAVIGKVWTDTYEASLRRLDETDESSAIHRNLCRQPNNKLATYIAKADRIDFIGDAQVECGDKPADDPQVTARVDEMVAEREAELATYDREQLIKLAMDRKNNIQAFIDANTASLRASLKYAVFAAEGEPLVTSDEQLDNLTEDAIEKIVQAANKALEVPKDADPLPSADSQE